MSNKFATLITSRWREFLDKLIGAQMVKKSPLL
jgi:hypothetical protein